MLIAEITMDTPLGPYCQTLGLTSAKLTNTQLQNLHVPESRITNGLVLEIKQHYDSLKNVVTCLKLLNPSFERVHNNTINSRILKLTENKKKLRNKKKVKGYKNLTDFLEEPVKFSGTITDVSLLTSFGHCPTTDTATSTFLELCDSRCEVLSCSV